MYKSNLYREADLRRAGELTPFPQRFEPLTDQRVPPLVLFYDTHFRPTNPKILERPVYTNSKGEHAEKKRNFMV